MMAPNSQKLGAVVWCNHGHRARWAEEASVVVGSSAVGINSAIGHGANSSALSLLVPGSPTDCVMARHYAPSDHLWPFVRLWAARRWLASWCRYEKNCAAIMRSSQDEFFVGTGRTNSGIGTVDIMLCGCVVWLVEENRQNLRMSETTYHRGHDMRRYNWYLGPFHRHQLFVPSYPWGVWFCVCSAYFTLFLSTSNIRLDRE